MARKNARTRPRLLIGMAVSCVLGASLGAVAQLQNTSVESQTVLNQQVAVMRQQCLQTARDTALSDLKTRDERLQREWCDATRDARRAEFSAAFVESVRRAKSGGAGHAKTVADFLRKTPAAIQPLPSYTQVCVDEKLRIDEALVAPVVDHPSLVGSLLGVRIRGKRVSRLNPVPRWDQLKKEGLVLRSPQMTYKVPFPTLRDDERASAIQGSQTRMCPSTAELDRALAAHAERAPTGDADATQADAANFVTSILTDSYQRQRLGPLVQLAQASARLPGLSASCDRDLRALLTDDELARKVTLELVRLVSPRSLQRVLEIRRSTGSTQLFSMDGQLRLFHPEDEREQARIMETSENGGGTAAFMVDAADVTVAANQALALGLYAWSSARSDLIALGCMPGRP